MAYTPPSTNNIAHSHPEAEQLSFRNLMEPLLVLFNRAVAMTLGNREFYMAYSIPGGIYGFFRDHHVTAGELDRIRTRISEMIGRKELVRQEFVSANAASEYFSAHRRPDIVHLLNSNREHKVRGEFNLAHINGNGELLLNKIRENYPLLESFRLEPFNGGFFLIADPAFFARAMPRNPERSKFFLGFEESEQTMKHLGIASFAELNDVIRNRELPEFIKLSEAYQNRKISQIADEIVHHASGTRIVFLAGPTSSGKTTSAHRLAIELRVMKKKVLTLSLDNYYLPHSAIPPDPQTGLQNFELISALDLDLFRHNINDLLAGKNVHLPKYHFDGKGARPQESATRITGDTYIIIEGIHGLNPGLWEDAMDTESYRLYVSALSTLNIHDHLPFSTSDHRLIRRMVRDRLFRGYSVTETLSRWPDVMKNEYLSIFPFQESAHSIFNSALIYEPAVFAHYAPAILQAEPAGNERVREELARVKRILALLTPIDPKDIPPTSILREFIGGSSFQYS